MTPEQRERFERQAILEAHATLLLRLVQAGAVDEYSDQAERVCQAVKSILALPKLAKKAA